jgi:putative oxidoreductase
LRRLFSNFAFGWPGVGLLLMRLVTGMALIVHGVETFRTAHPVEPAILGLLAIGDGVLVVAGLWTPIAGSLVVTLALWSTTAQNENPCSAIYCSAIYLITLGVALVLLGPGGWSMDAHLFGWKRIDSRTP